MTASSEKREQWREAARRYRAAHPERVRARLKEARNPSGIPPSRETLGERSRRHGHVINRSPTPTYKSWAAMITRCTNPNVDAYERYGGKGIKVCERWRDFEKFLQDMGERPGLKHSLDRFPNRKGNYEPGNCRWATHREQRLNQDRRFT